MLQSINLVIIITALFPLTALGMPTMSTNIDSLETSKGMSKRAAGDLGAELCTDDDWQGVCSHIFQPKNACVNLEDNLNDKVSSVGLDRDAGDCRFYFDYDCKDDNGWRHFDMAHPGNPNLYLSNNGANDQISSYQCFGT